MSWLRSCVLSAIAIASTTTQNLRHIQNVAIVQIVVREREREIAVRVLSRNELYIHRQETTIETKPTPASSMVQFKIGSKARNQQALATLVDDEEVNLPYTEVNLEGAVSSTSKDDSLESGNHSNINNTNVEPSAQLDKPAMARRLTEVSSKYDRDGKGYLNETERALRRLDSTNKGFLEDDKVCELRMWLLMELFY